MADNAPKKVSMIILSTDDLDSSIAFYEGLGFPLKFRDGDHFAALDGKSIVLALATEIDHPIPGQVVVAINTGDVDGELERLRTGGAVIVREPYDAAHERRAIVHDDQGNGLVLFTPTPH